MSTALSLATSLAGALATYGLQARAGFGPGSLGLLGLWAVAPYLGHAVVAVEVRGHRDSAVTLLMGTVATAFLANLVFANDLQPWVEARGRGDEPPMNCGGPLLLLGLPILQWIFLGTLAYVASTSRPARPDEAANGLDGSNSRQARQPSSQARRRPPATG